MKENILECLCILLSPYGDWSVSCQELHALIDVCCARGMCRACLFAVPQMTEMFFVASFSFALGTGVWLGSREATHRTGWVNPVPGRQSSWACLAGQNFAQHAQRQGFCEDQSRQKAKLWKCPRKSLSSEPRVVCYNLKMEQNFLYVLFFPMSVLVPMFYSFIRVLPAIRNPEFSQMNVSESFTVLWLPDIWEGGEGCDVLEASSILVALGLCKLIGKLLSPFVIAPSGRK